MCILSPINQLVIGGIASAGRESSPQIASENFGIDSRVAHLLASTSDAVLNRLSNSLFTTCFSIRDGKQFWASILSGGIDAPKGEDNLSAPDPQYVSSIKTFNRQLLHYIVDLVKTDKKYAACQFNISISHTEAIAKMAMHEILNKTLDRSSPLFCLSWDVSIWRELIADVNESHPEERFPEYVCLISTMKNSASFGLAGI